MTEHDHSAIAAPLVIGVTGHRHLRDADIETLRTQVRAFFLDLQTRYPDLPLVVLSPLAEGGDRLVAEATFDLGLRVIAPLPLPADQYRDDFDGADSLEAPNEGLAKRRCLNCKRGSYTHELRRRWNGIASFAPHPNPSPAGRGASNRLP